MCVTMIGTNSGNVYPFAAIGRRTAAAGVLMFLDACRAEGHMELDVTEFHCQVLTGTGWKFLCGSRGSGLLWVSESIIDRFTPHGIEATSSASATGSDRPVRNPKVAQVVNGGPETLDAARRETPGQRRGHSTTLTHLMRRRPSCPTARVV